MNDEEYQRSIGVKLGKPKADVDELKKSYVGKGSVFLGESHGQEVTNVY